jgi:hypothetical protein
MRVGLGVGRRITLPLVRGGGREEWRQGVGMGASWGGGNAAGREGDGEGGTVPLPSATTTVHASNPVFQQRLATKQDAGYEEGGDRGVLGKRSESRGWRKRRECAAARAAGDEISCAIRREGKGWEGGVKAKRKREIGPKRNGGLPEPEPRAE